MRKLSPRKLQVFNAIQSFSDETRYPPTVTMHRHLDDLRNDGSHNLGKTYSAGRRRFPNYWKLGNDKAYRKIITYRG